MTPGLSTTCESWGRFPHARHHLHELAWITDPLPVIPAPETMLPYGNGRSYGDSCLNDGQSLLLTRGLRHFLHFDRDAGLLRCEAGVTLDEILQLIVPAGWFLPTTPGTKYITLGGAIANDIHGKNHHRAGCFGRHVTQFEILRSDGRRLVCSPEKNADLFRATIGGLGLTGLITWVEFSLRRIESAYLDTEAVQFSNLDEFLRLTEDDHLWEYTVGWIDCVGGPSTRGRGVYMRGNHAQASEGGLVPHRAAKLRVPIDAPPFALNRLSMQALATAYYHKQIHKRVTGIAHYDPFFYPLDSILDWNRAYGRLGFFQYQFVVPFEHAVGVLRKTLDLIANSGQASFLAVIKTFGEIKSPGLLSFPRPGLTLALDFPNRGAKTESLFERLDDAVFSGGGRLYPGKDARMKASDFHRSYPELKDFLPHIDPRFSSGFWRRVNS